MQTITKFLEGKKTYIVAAAVALTTFAFMVGWIDNNTAIEVYGLLGAGGMVALRSAIAKLKS